MLINSHLKHKKIDHDEEEELIAHVGYASLDEISRVGKGDKYHMYIKGERTDYGKV